MKYEWTDTSQAMAMALERICLQVIYLPKCEESALKFARDTLNVITASSAHSSGWLTDRLTQICHDLDANEKRL